MTSITTNAIGHSSAQEDRIRIYCFVTGPNAKLSKITRESDEGATQFEVEYVVGADECSANLSEGGQILELESQIPVTQVPAALMKALDKKFPGAAVKKAETVEVRYYEFELTVGGKARKVMATATGQFFEEEED